MGFLVVVALAVVIFIGLKNKKKIAAEQLKAAEEKKIADQKAAEEKKIADQKATEEKKIAEEKKVAALINDEIAKQYYAIACGLLDSIKPDGKTCRCNNVKSFAL